MPNQHWKTVKKYNFIWLLGDKLLPEKIQTLHDEYKCKENFVLLQSIGIIAIKSSKTRAVIYTYRYSSGQFNP